MRRKRQTQAEIEMQPQVLRAICRYCNGTGKSVVKPRWAPVGVRIAPTEYDCIRCIGTGLEFPGYPVS